MPFWRQALHFEMQMRDRRVAGLTDIRDDLPLLHRFALRQPRGAGIEMGVVINEVLTRIELVDCDAAAFAFEELLARVRSLLRRPSQSDSLHLEYQDIRIDLAQQRATRADVTLDLTAKELPLLTMFLRPPGRVLSRTRIYETVWDENFDGVSNTLEVHIKDLRRKLEKLGPRVIQTRRSQGYILEMLQ